MARRGTRRIRPGSPPKRVEDDRGTRERLLEAAGQVFAEKGVDRATGKEICERAGTNAAAVNYHFGGMEGLYSAVLREAANRLVSSESLRAAVAGAADARSKLEAFLSLIVRALTDPGSSSWVFRVLGREAVAPSPALDAAAGEERLQRGRLLRSVVGELMGLPEDHPAVARGCISVIGPCFLLLICDRSAHKQMFPSLGLTPADAPALTRHLVEFALAGLSAVADDAPGGNPRRTARR